MHGEQPAIQSDSLSASDPDMDTGQDSSSTSMPVKKPACSSAAAALAASPPVRSPSVNKPVPWARVSAVAGGEVAGAHFMSGAGCWPALSSRSGVTMPPAVVAAPKSEASIAAAGAAPSPPQPTRVASSSTGNQATERTGQGDRAAPAPARAAPAPETRGAVPEPHAPAHAPNQRSNGAAARHQHGRFPSHHHSRGAHNAGRGKGIDGGSSIDNGNCIANVNFNCYGDNGGGVRLRHGQGHRGGGHHDGHGQPGPQMPPYVTAPHHHPHLHYPFPVPLPPMPFFAPPMPPSPFCGAYYGPVIGYAQTEFAAAGWHVPPPPDAVHFVPYPALPVHATLPHMEQQAAPPSPQHMEEQPQQQAAPAHAEEPELVQPSEEELEEKIRCQIEFYFSENNLCEDLYLKEQMDEQGWVPLTEIMGFKKVKEKTTDLQLILRSLASSTEVEVQDGRIRRRLSWGKYILRRHIFHDN